MQPYTQAMAEADPPTEAAGEPASAPGGSGPGALPEFLNPESAHYQPWAEKQISNASKDKRPLADYMAEMELRLGEYGELPTPGWDPGRQDQLLARFSSPAPGRTRRRRRRGPGPARDQAPQAPHSQRPPQQRRPKAAPVTAAPGTSGTVPAGTGPKRRRRRRRPRGGPTGGAPTA